MTHTEVRVYKYGRKYKSPLPNLHRSGNRCVELDDGRVGAKMRGNCSARSAAPSRSRRRINPTEVGRSDGFLLVAAGNGESSLLRVQ